MISCLDHGSHLLSGPPASARCLSQPITLSQLTSLCSKSSYGSHLTQNKSKVLTGAPSPSGSDLLSHPPPSPHHPLHPYHPAHHSLNTLVLPPQGLCMGCSLCLESSLPDSTMTLSLCSLRSLFKRHLGNEAFSDQSLPLQPAPRHPDPSRLFSCLFSCSALNCPAYYVIYLFTVLGISCLSLLDHRIFSHIEDGGCALFKTLSQQIEQFLVPTQCSINIYGMNEINPLRNSAWPSLAVQWIRIHLQVRETQVQSLVREDSVCLQAAKPMTAITEPAL